MKNITRAEQNGITGSIEETLPAITAELCGKSHANLAHIHLNSAKIFTDLALAIDQHYKNSAPQDVINSYMSYVSSVIICSVAALESTINQFMVDNSNKLNISPHKDDDSIFKKFKRLNKKENILRQLHAIPNVMLKYDVVFFLLKKKFITHNKLKEDVGYLVYVRNALVHFTPEWDNALGKHGCLEKSRKNRFTDSSFYDSKALFFPYRCLNGSCASWGHETAASFIEMFTSNIR